jgi:hypothetical protein
VTLWSGRHAATRPHPLADELAAAKNGCSRAHARGRVGPWHAILVPQKALPPLENPELYLFTVENVAAAK